MLLRKSAFFLAMTAGVLGVLPATTWAQEQPEQPGAVTEVPTAKFTFVGEVTGSSVNVRSGPAESHYPTMKLSKGDKVIVVGHKFDWLKIQPPEGSFSYVAKIFVDRDAAGTSGKVTRNDVVVRAGSSLNAMSSEVQTKLNTGDTVQILGEANEYYKVKPPEGAYLYVAKQFVTPVRQATTGEAVPGPAGAAEQERTAEPTAVTARENAPAGEATAQPPVQVPGAAASGDQELQFRRLEQEFKQASALPMEERPVADLLKGYTALQTGALSATSQRMVQYRVAYLKALQQQQEELKQAKQTQSDFDARQTELQGQRQAIQEKISASAIKSYTAVGQLQTSTLEKDGQTLLRLVDPADGRTLVYLRGVDPKQGSQVGTFVGVNGEIVRDDRLSVDVIQPTTLEPVDQAKVLRGITARIYPPSAAKGQ